MTLIYDDADGNGGGYRCDGCGAITREFISTSPFGGASPAPPWIHRPHWRQHFCSAECVAAHAEQQRERVNARRRERRARAQNARPPAICAHCGEPFRAMRSTARYCSTRCRVAAHRASG